MVPFVSVLSEWLSGKKAMTTHHVARIARVSEKQIGAWLKGTEAPDKREFQRLRKANPRFNYCRLPSDEDIEAARVAEKARRAKNDTDGTSLFEIAEPNNVAPFIVRAFDEKKETFREALKRLRGAEQMSAREFSDLIGTSTRTLGRWEEGESTPSKEQYALLLNLLPGLRDAEPPPEMKPRSDDDETVSEDGASTAQPDSSKVPREISPELQEALKNVEVTLDRRLPQVISSHEMDRIMEAANIPRKEFNKALREQLGLATYRAGFGAEGVWYWSKIDFRGDAEIMQRLRKSAADVEAKEPEMKTTTETGPSTVYVEDRAQRIDQNAVVVTKRATRLSETRPVRGVPNVAPSRALSAAIDQAPIRLPYAPQRFQLKRYVPRHCVMRFQERYLYGTNIRPSFASCQYLIDYLVEQAIQEGYFEWVEEGGEKLCVVAVPGMTEKQAFFFLVREDQMLDRPEHRGKEVILTCVPGDSFNQGEVYGGKINGVVLNMPFQRLAEEFREIQEQVPSRGPAEPQVIVTSGRGIDRPTSEAGRIVPPTPPPPPPKPNADLPEDPVEAGMALGEAIKTLREKQARVAAARKALEEVEREIEAAQAEVKRRQEHILGLG